jgi:hypothetical protein
VSRHRQQRAELEELRAATARDAELKKEKDELNDALSA